MTDIKQDIVEKLNQVGNNPAGLEVITTQVKNESVELKKEVDSFVADEKNKQQAWALAIDIERCIGQRWCTLDRIATKIKLTNEVTFQKLKLLELFGYVVIDKGKGERSRERGQWVFRIVLTSKQKIESLQKVISTYCEEIDKLQLQIKILSASEPIRSMEFKF